MFNNSSISHHGSAAAANPRSSAAPSPSLRRSWISLGLIFAASVLNTLDKNLIPALLEPIRNEIGLSDSQFGMLAGTVFAVPYAICAIPISLLIDKVEPEPPPGVAHRNLERRHGPWRLYQHIRR